MRQRVRWWKVLGLAGLAGVAASGVVIARAERRRRAYTPEEIRARLRERHAQAATGGPAPADDPA
ncbi:hypothetical protein ACFY3U_14705 [Micromonospora sp. NPDC000089]|uniref:hypothetical protein n=1 Tax=unclassified Micromonospora TaxID=2617518 RepID=UPI00367C7A31